VPTKAQGLDGWPQRGFDRIIKHRVSMLESALGFVRTGEVAIYLPSFIADFIMKQILKSIILKKESYKRDLKILFKTSTL
jgi:hypothetical protein